MSGDGAGHLRRQGHLRVQELLPELNGGLRVHIVGPHQQHLHPVDNVQRDRYELRRSMQLDAQQLWK